MDSLLGVIVGFLLGLLPAHFDKKKRLRAHFGALKSEVAQCVRLGNTYLTDNVKAPLYRLPLQAYTTSFSALLADGALSESESTALSEFYGVAMQLNRGLDNADHFHKVEHLQLLDAEYQRNKKKALQLQPGTDNAKYDAAMAVINAHL